MTQRLRDLANGWGGSDAVITLSPDAVADLRALGADVTEGSDGVCRQSVSVIRGALDPPEKKPKRKRSTPVRAQRKK